MLECTVETYIISFRTAAQFELLTMRHQESLTEQIELRLWDTPRLILRGRRDKAVAGRRAAGGVLVLKETVPLSAAAGRTRVQQLKPDVTPRDPAQILLLKRNCVFCPCGYIYIRFNGFPQEQKKRKVNTLLQLGYKWRQLQGPPVGTNHPTFLPFLAFIFMSLLKCNIHHISLTPLALTHVRHKGLFQAGKEG